MNAKDLIDDPGFLAYKFNFESENVEFLTVQRDEIRQAPSLKQEYFASGQQIVAVPLAELVELSSSRLQGLTDKPPRFIFHTAFCASTFLSRCLDVDGVCIGLREPQILLDAANAKRLQWRSRTTQLDHSHLPGLALTLLQKHATARETLLIKPMNCVNNIIPELMQLTGSPQSLMLYTDARNFLLSTLRKGEGGKQTVRSMFDLLRCDFPHLSNLQLTHTIHMTDLRIIMTLWRLQLEQAELALQQFSTAGKMASLYGEDLIREPSQVIRAANQFLGLGISSTQINAIANSDERLIDAKNSSKKFSLEERGRRYQQLERFYGDDLDDGLEWLQRNNPGTQLRPEPSGPLKV